MAGRPASSPPRREQHGGAIVIEDLDFFAPAARAGGRELVTTLRRTHPGVSVADIYQHPVLRQLADRLDELTSPRRSQRVVRPAPHGSGLARMLVLLLTATLTGIRSLIVFGIVADVLRLGWSAAAVHPVPELVVAGWSDERPGRSCSAIGVRCCAGDQARRGRRGGLPTAGAGSASGKLRNRLVQMTAHAGLHVLVADPAYTSRWGTEPGSPRCGSTTRTTTGHSRRSAGDRTTRTRPPGQAPRDREPHRPGRRRHGQPPRDPGQPRQPRPHLGNRPPHETPGSHPAPTSTSLTG